MKASVRKTTTVEPSSRDSINAWLDVLTSMLALPEHQRAQVRDELEDHLRSRVDDLLILGKSEPDAVQIAIHEIGETAELAKHISTVSRTRTTPRRLIMNATLFVLAGTILAASVSTMMPSAATTAEQIAASESISSLVENPTDPLATTMIDVREGTIGEMVSKIESSTALPVIVHWGLLSDIGFDQDARVDIHSAPLSAELTLTILAERTEPTLRDSIAILQTPDQLEIGTRTQFDRRTTDKRLYDLSVLANEQSDGSLGRISNSSRSTRNTMEQVADLIRTHISSDEWVRMGGDLAKITVLNTTMVVSAPERMHNEIEQLLSELKQVHTDAQRERIVEHQERINRIRSERDRVHKELTVAYDKQHTIALEQQEEWDRDDSDKKSTNFQPILSELQREIKDLENRSAYLSELLMEQEYLELSAENGAGLSAVPPLSSKPMGMDVITITGPNVARAGVYEFVAGLTVNRLLTISDAKLTPQDSIQIYREGQLVSEKTVEDTYSTDHENQQLIAGDRIQILPAS